jgi:hypothetical protein
VIAAAGSFEDIDGKVGSNLLEVASIPIAQLAVFIEEGNRTPFPFSRYEFVALNGFGQLENPLKIRIAKLAENAAQLVKKLGSECTFVRRWDLSFALGIQKGSDKQQADDGKKPDRPKRTMVHLYRISQLN